MATFIYPQIDISDLAIAHIETNTANTVAELQTLIADFVAEDFAQESTLQTIAKESTLQAVETAVSGIAADIANLATEATVQTLATEATAQTLAKDSSVQAVVTAVSGVATEATLQTIATEATLQALSSSLTGLATEATLATLATEATAQTLATEATLQTLAGSLTGLATEATVATLATEATVQTLATEATVMNLASEMTLTSANNTLNNIYSTISAPDTVRATAYNQTSGSQKTQISDSSGNAVHITSNALDVNIASGSITASNPSVSPTGAAEPAQATLVGGSDGTDLVALSVDATGALALPQGAATAAKQDVANVSLASIASGLSSVISAGNSSSTPLVANATFTGTWTDITNYSSIIVSVASNIQSAMNGFAIQFSADASTVHSEVNRSTIYPYSGGSTFTVTPEFKYFRVVYQNFGYDQTAFDLTSTLKPTAPTPKNVATEDTLLELYQVSDDTRSNTYASSVALGNILDSSNFIKSLTGGQYNSTPPTLYNGQQSLLQLDSSGNLKVAGSITATNSANGNTGTTQPTQATLVGGSDGTNLRALKVSATGVVSVDGSAVTQPVSAASLPLPTGAATSANQTTTNSSLSSIDGKLPANLTVSSTRLLVDNSGVTQPVTQTGTLQANAPVYNAYASTSVTTAAYTQLVASTSFAANGVEIFDSSGQALYLAVGAAGSEVNQMIIFPGGNGRVNLQIPAGSRVSVKALTGTASSGYLAINFYR